MKNILHILTAFASMLCLSASAQTSLTIGNPSALAGSAVAVPVTAVGIADMQGFQFTIDYDMSKLTYVNCSDWAGGTNATGVQINPISGQGKLTFVYNDVSVNISSGLFFNINFTIDAAASGVAALNWSDSPTPRELSNSVPVVISATYAGGNVTIQTESAISSNTISADETICLGDVPSALDGSTPSGGNGTFAYLWLSSTTSSTVGFAAASGTNDQQNYSPSALGVTTWFVREVSSGSFTNQSSAVEITVVPLPDATPSSLSEEFCEGGSTIISSLGDGNVTYTWLDGNQNPITTGNDFTVSASGTYYLQAEENNCTATSTGITVTENPLPDATPSSLSEEFCEGGSTIISSLGDGNVTYTWLDGSQNPITTGNDLTVSASGTYYLQAEENNCTAISTGITVAENPLPDATPNPSSASLCEGQTATINTPGDGNVFYVWLDSDLNTISTDQFEFVTSESGTYYLLAQDNCENTSDAIIITVNPLPTAPVITQSGADLQSSYATGNQWYLDGDIIDGAIGQTYTPTANGNYTVVHTDANTCEATSQPYNMLTVGIAAAGNNAFAAEPNPTTGQFNLRMPLGTYSLEVFSPMGQLVYSKTLQGSTTHQIDLGTVAKGMYTLRLANADGMHHQRIIVQ